MTRADAPTRIASRQPHRKLSWPGMPGLGEWALNLAYIGWIPLAMLIVGLVVARSPPTLPPFTCPGRLLHLLPLTPQADSRKAGCKNCGRGDSPSMPTSPT
jgi:hypothetical protein